MVMHLKSGFLPRPKNMLIGGNVCACMLPCNGLLSHPGCIPASHPVFQGYALDLHGQDKMPTEDERFSKVHRDSLLQISCSSLYSPSHTH